MHPYSDETIVENAEVAIAVFDYVNGPSTIWLRIETYAYYSYIGATMFYILYMQCRGFYRNKIITDLNK